MQTDLIIINDYCDRCHVDPSFIVELAEDGLMRNATSRHPNWRNWSVTHICIMICLSILPVLMPFITCWNVLSTCNAKYVH